MLFVEYDDAAIELSAIAEVIVRIGYEVVHKRNDSTVTLPIGGMTCAACARRVEKAIGKLEGVTSATVNYAIVNATVTYEPKTVRLSAIRAAVENAGYKPLEMKKTLSIKAQSWTRSSLLEQPPRCCSAHTTRS